VVLADRNYLTQFVTECVALASESIEAEAGRKSLGRTANVGECVASAAAFTSST